MSWKINVLKAYCKIKRKKKSGKYAVIHAQYKIYCLIFITITKKEEFGKYKLRKHCFQKIKKFYVIQLVLLSIENRTKVKKVGFICKRTPL